MQAEALLKKRLQRLYIRSLLSYSLIYTPNQAVRMRYIAIITIILLQSAISALSILLEVI